MTTFLVVAPAAIAFVAIVGAGLRALVVDVRADVARDRAATAQRAADARTAAERERAAAHAARVAQARAGAAWAAGEGLPHAAAVWRDLERAAVD